MNNTIIQINETKLNESFEPVNNVLGEFEKFSSNLFSQIMGWITPMIENLVS